MKKSLLITRLRGRVTASISFVNGSVASRSFSSMTEAWAWLRRFDELAIVSAEVESHR
jgi:hypothetical protein